MPSSTLPDNSVKARAAPSNRWTITRLLYSSNNDEKGDGTWSIASRWPPVLGGRLAVNRWCDSANLLSCVACSADCWVVKIQMITINYDLIISICYELGECGQWRIVFRQFAHINLCSMLLSIRYWNRKQRKSIELVQDRRQARASS